MRNSNDGFTLAELVVSISLVGVLMSFAIPSYQSNVHATQRQTNVSNMEDCQTDIYDVLARRTYDRKP